MNRSRGKAAAVLTAAAGLTLLASGTAQAHVRVSAPKAVVGQSAMLDFRVPSEEQVATTIRMSIAVPADVTVSQVPAVTGWMNVTAKDTAGDTVLTWTAQEAGLAPAQSADLLVDVGPLPSRPTVSFDVVQTYSNGDMVYWNQQQTGSAEPPFPAPTLTLAGAAAGAVADRPSLTPAPTVDPAANPDSPSSADPGVTAGAPLVDVAAPARSAGTSAWTIGVAVAGSGVLGAAATAAALMWRRRGTVRARR